MFVDKKNTYIISLSTLAVLLLAFFVPGEHSGVAISSVCLLMLAVVTVFFLKKRSILSVNKKEVLLIMCIIGVVYVTVYYLCGIAPGFFKNIYFLDFSYIIPIVINIVAIEVIRCVNLSQNSKFSDAICYINCVLSEMLVFGNIYRINSFNRFMDFVGLTLFPAIIANILYHYLSKRYGIYPNIAYRLIITLHAYIIPYKPYLPDSLVAFANLFVPIFIYIFIDSLYEKKRRYALEKKSKLSPILTGVSVVILAAFIMLISNQFKYGALVIATESMTGEIEKGDAVIFEEYTDQMINEGQVIVFEKNDSMIVHRVADIQNIDGITMYFTKGDANQELDPGYITSEQIQGIVNFKIPYVGYPTIWLRSLFTR